MTERVWSAAEVELLRTHLQQDGAHSIATRLHRTTDSVSSQARRLGLRSRGHQQPRSRPSSSRAGSTAAPVVDHPDLTRIRELIERWGTVRPRARYRLRLSVPMEHGAELLAVRSMLRSHHAVRVRARRLVTEICGRVLIESLLRRLGLPVR